MRVPQSTRVARDHEDCQIKDLHKCAKVASHGNFLLLTLGMLLQVAAGSSLAQSVSTELLMIVKLFSRLAQSAASIGQDILRVTQPVHYLGEEGADALDLACQVADTLCKLPSHNLELLGLSLLTLHAWCPMSSAGLNQMLTSAAPVQL